MTARWVALGVWAAVAASLAYWGLKLFVPGAALPAHTEVAPVASRPHGELMRLLGDDPVPVAADQPPPNTRFQLIGVVAPHSAAAAREGLALIAVDGKPPRAYRVGAVVEGQTVLQTVRARGVALGPRDGAAQVSLEIPPPQPAATGTRPAAGAAPARAPRRGVALSPRAVAADPEAPPPPVVRPRPQAVPEGTPSDGDEALPTQ